MRDIKGQAVIGYGTSTSYGLGLGGVYTTALGPPIIEDGWPYGTVPLNISRDGPNIRITWEAIFIDPQIYILTGDGSGQYTNDHTAWTLVTGTTPDFTISTTQLVHSDQVGDASTTNPAVYYKALQAGVTTDTTDPVSGDRCIEIAWAVGKVDFLKSSGWNSASAPFSAETFGGAAGVVGDNFGEGDTVYFWDYYNDGTQDMSEVKRFSSTTGWDKPAINLSLGQGCMFNISSLSGTDTRKITLIGKVSPADVLRDIQPGWNDLGDAFPKALVSGGFLPANAAPPENLVNGDSISEWEWGGDDFINTIRYDDSSTPPWLGSLTFKPGVGYWYNHVSTAGPFQWTVRK